MPTGPSGGAAWRAAGPDPSGRWAQRWASAEVVSLGVQLYMFLVLVLTGVAWSLCFDVYRAWRSLARPRGWRSDLGDLVFWLAGALLVAGGLFLGNWGDLRLYVFLGLALGGYLYFRLASPTILPVLRRLFRTLSRMLRWLGRQLLRPARGTVRGARGAARRLRAWLRKLRGFL